VPIKVTRDLARLLIQICAEVYPEFAVVDNDKEVVYLLLTLYYTVVCCLLFIFGNTYLKIYKPMDMVSMHMTNVLKMRKIKDHNSPLYGMSIT
jgi:hypothetical protein